MNTYKNSNSPGSDRSRSSGRCKSVRSNKMIAEDDPLPKIISKQTKAEKIIRRKNNSLMNNNESRPGLTMSVKVCN